MSVEFKSLEMSGIMKVLDSGNLVINHGWRNLDFVDIIAIKLLILTFLNPLMSKHVLTGEFPGDGRSFFKYKIETSYPPPHL